MPDDHLNDTRRENLRALVDRVSGYAELARRLGYERSEFLIHMAGPNPSRNVTERTARIVEDKLKFPAYSMDKPLPKALVKTVRPQ